jgi:hypothetical protein
MKIFSLLTFCFTIAFATVVSAKPKDEVKAPKSRTQPAKNFQQAGPKKVSPPRHVPQAPKMHRNIPPTPVGPRIHNTQPKVRQPVTTVQPNPKIHREDWQDQPRIHRKPTVTQVPQITPPVRTDTNRKWNRNDQDNNNRDWRNRNDQDNNDRDWRNRNVQDNSNRNWRNRNNDNSWQNARRRHHRQHRHRDWWRSHYTRFALFGAGYYFWDAGYWYPAYGYDPAYNSYSYEEPIYGYGDLEPAQVIANVQTELQRMGYYRYAVDGQMGPMTRAAIAAYQRDNGLAITSAIDEPTLQLLGLA